MTQNWEIDKTFNFCYGHRVWVQELNTDYTEEGHCKPKCRMLHGHEGMVQVFLKGDVDHRGMVEDFVNLGWVKNFLDDNLDHRFIIDMNDPWFPQIVNGTIAYGDEGRPKHLIPSKPLNTSNLAGINFETIKVPGTDYIVGWSLDTSELTGPEQEFFSGFFMVNFVPTSELLCKWLFEAVDAKMKLIDVKVSKISWNETPKSRAIYSRPE